MKRSQILSFVLALAIVLAAAFLGSGAQEVAPAPSTNGIVATPTQGTDDGQTTPVAPDEPSQTTEDPKTDANNAQAPPVQEVVDDGIELAEGITDARAQQAADAAKVTIEKNGTYPSKVEVALYIHTYGRVPSNYVSKTKARNAGWVSSEGNLWDVLPGMSIGGGGYTNEQWGNEPLLPETPQGRDWRECDINYQGGYRGAERLVYSDDGLVFYTGDHYETFERLY